MSVLKNNDNKHKMFSYMIRLFYSFLLVSSLIGCGICVDGYIEESCRCSDGYIPVTTEVECGIECDCIDEETYKNNTKQEK